jgi:hypothetical protein
MKCFSSLSTYKLDFFKNDYQTKVGHGRSIVWRGTAEKDETPFLKELRKGTVNCSEGGGVDSFSPIANQCGNVELAAIGKKRVENLRDLLPSN